MPIIERTIDTEGNVISEEVIEEKSPYMRITDAAKYHDVSVWTIHEWCRQGLLTKHRAGGSVHNVRLLRAEVEGLFKPETADAS